MTGTHTPVALIVFNRPGPTGEVFAEIARARPKKLFIIADGPRAEREGEAERCMATRAVVERIDWPCDVQRNYSDSNLGCRERIVSGLNWVFDQVEEAIILEDDCVPSASFFRFCDEVLAKYREEDRVMMVSGRYSQFQAQELTSRFRYSYEFVYSGNCWGWATWRRAWEHLDMSLKEWPRLRDTSWLEEMFGQEEVQAFRRNLFDEVYSSVDDIDAWDYQWGFSMWARGGLTIVPARHMIANVGFGDDATHTRSGHNQRGRLLGTDLQFPVRHPPRVERNVALDDDLESLVIRPPRRKKAWHHRLRGRFSRAMKRWYGTSPASRQDG